MNSAKLFQVPVDICRSENSPQIFRVGFCLPLSHRNCMYANDFRSPKNRRLCEMVVLIAYKLSLSYSLFGASKTTSE